MNCHSYPQLMVPSVILLFSSFLPQGQQSSRMGWWWLFLREWASGEGMAKSSDNCGGTKASGGGPAGGLGCRGSGGSRGRVDTSA